MNDRYPGLDHIHKVYLPVPPNYSPSPKCIVCGEQIGHMEAAIFIDKPL